MSKHKEKGNDSLANTTNTPVNTSGPTSLSKNSLTTNIVKLLSSHKILFSVLGILVLLLGLVMGLSLVNKENNASAGLNCPAGTVVTATGCQPRAAKVNRIINLCPDGTAPDASNRCNASQNIVWRCDNRAGEFFLIGGDANNAGNYNLCTSFTLGNNFWAGRCEYAFVTFDAPSSNQYQRADRFDDALNYRNTADNDNFCLDRGTCIATMTNNFNNGFPMGPICVEYRRWTGCPADMRVMFMEATVNYGTFNGAYPNDTQILCVKRSLLGRTDTNSSLYTIAGGLEGSYVYDRKCGDNPGGGSVLPNYGGTVTLMGDQYGNFHREVVWLCGKTSYAATNSQTVSACPTTHPTDTGDGSATPCVGAINNTGATYTPEPGDVTAITCKDSSGAVTTTFVENTNATCTLTLKSPPAGISTYTGSVTLTLTDGGNVVCSLTGASTTAVCPSMNVGSSGAAGANVTKTFSTDKGGSLPITVGKTVINNSNWQTALGNCPAPAATTTNSTYNCVFPLVAGYKFPAAGVLDFKSTTSTADNGIIPLSTPAEISCTYPPDGSSAGLTCNNIPTGATNGDREILLKLDTYADKGDVTIGNTIVTETNFATALNDCTPTPANPTVNSTYNCIYTLKPGYQFPASGTFLSTTSDAANSTTPIISPGPANCNFAPNGTGNVTCTNIPTGSTTGAKNILLKLNASNYADKGDVAMGNTVITPTNWKDAFGTCTMPTGVIAKSTYNCTFPLKPGYELPPNTGLIFKAATSSADNVLTPIAQLSDNCTYIPSATGGIICNNIPAGTTSGEREILLNLVAEPGAYIDAGDLTVNPIIPTPITNSNITTASCISPKNVGETTVCTATLANTTDKTGTVTITLTSGTNTITCTTPVITSGATTATCTTPAFTAPGTYAATAKASGQLDAATVSAGDVVVTIPTALITTADLTNLSLSCGSLNNYVIIPAGQTSTTTTCKGILPPNTVLDSANPLKLRIDNATTDSSTCTATGSEIECLQVPTGSLTGARIIYAKLGTTTTLTDTLNKTNVYSANHYIDANLDFLKTDTTTGVTSAVGKILHKEWRLSEANNTTSNIKLKLSNLKIYSGLKPNITTTIANATGMTPVDNDYTCTFYVRPAGSGTGSANDVNSTGWTTLRDTNTTTANTTIPYTAASGCSVNFNSEKQTSATEVQPAMTNALAKNYNWEVRVDIKDKAATPNIVKTIASSYGFKFAGFISGG